MATTTSSTLRFGTIDVSRQVFSTSRHSFALVNLKPILPGHVLVVPRASSRLRFKALPPDEVLDLFLLAQRVSRMLERVYGASAITMAMQDGREAGQTIEHLHLHLLPRHKGDKFAGERNDEVYPAIDEHERGLGRDEERRPRSTEEMENEARRLKAAMEGGFGD